MKQWWLIIALLLSLGVNVGILASRAFLGRGPAADPTEAREEPPKVAGLPPFVYRLADQLGLESEARDHFLARQQVFFDQTLTARVRIGQLQSHLRLELLSDEPDRDTLDQLLGELAEAQVDLERALIENLLDSRETLSREQVRQFMGILARIRSPRGELRRRLHDHFGDRGPWMERRRGGDRRPRHLPGHPPSPSPGGEEPPP